MGEGAAPPGLLEVGPRLGGGRPGGPGVLSGRWPTDPLPESSHGQALPCTLPATALAGLSSGGLAGAGGTDAAGRKGVGVVRGVGFRGGLAAPPGGSSGRAKVGAGALPPALRPLRRRTKFLLTAPEGAGAGAGAAPRWGPPARPGVNWRRLAAGPSGWPPSPPRPRAARRCSGRCDRSEEV